MKRHQRLRKKIQTDFTRASLFLMSLFVASALPVSSVAARVTTVTSTSTSTAAACTAPSPSYGTATLQLSVDEAGTYKIWTHMYASSSSSDSVMLEVDGSNCYTVGNGNVATQAWTWVGHKDGSSTSYVTATLSSGTHAIKLFGNEPSVKVDRVLAVADQSCTPSGNGDNCMATADTTKPTISITSPTDASTVSGAVVVKATAADDTGVEKVEFYVQGSLVSTDTSSPYEYSWDTSSLANQSYTITAKAYDAEENTSSDSITLVVNNEVAQTIAAVSSLTASATSYTTVDLQWIASSNATSYRILRDGIVIATTSQTSYTDATAASGSTYKYTVVAVDSSGNTSEASNAAQVTIPTPPVTDTSAPSTPTNLSVTAQSTSQINLTWTASTDDIGVEGYDIYRNSDENPTFTKIATTTNTSYGDGGVYDNTTFTYYIVAFDAEGNTSEPSAQVSATTPTLYQQKKSTLRGTVHGSDGRPLSGVRVTVWVGSKRYQATTNWRGRYIISSVPSGKYEVTFRKGGYERESNYVSLRANKTRWEDVDLSY